MNRSQHIPALVLALALAIGTTSCGGSEEDVTAGDTPAGSTTTTAGDSADGGEAEEGGAPVGDGETTAPESPVTSGEGDDADGGAEGDAGVGGDGGETDGGGEPADPPAGAATGSSTRLEISVTHPADPDAVTYVIDCADDGAATITPGVEPLDATAACNALELPDVRARLVDGPPADRMCTEIFGGPDEADVVGVIDGAAVDTTITRSDGCAIDDWDRLLVDLLPPGIGVTG